MKFRSGIMRDINKFLVLGLIAAAALFTTGIASTVSLQEAYAQQSNDCHDNVVGVCANVCANVNVLAKQKGSQCD
jgi:hypothetical protein